MPRRVFHRLSGLLALFVCGVVGLSAQDSGTIEWRSYAADLASTFYSPADQIDASNFNDLEVAWRFSTHNFGPRPEVILPKMCSRCAIKAPFRARLVLTG